MMTNMVTQRDKADTKATVMLLLVRESFVRAQRVYGNAIIKHRREITLADK